MHFLLDIVRSRLPEAEFAFLSACHTADLTEKSIADQALHLAAAMQCCGFRSVIDTVWTTGDTDGRDLDYGLLQAGVLRQDALKQGVRYYEITA